MTVVRIDLDNISGKARRGFSRYGDGGPGSKVSSSSNSEPAIDHISG